MDYDDAITWCELNGWRFDGLRPCLDGGYAITLSPAVRRATSGMQEVIGHGTSISQATKNAMKRAGIPVPTNAIAAVLGDLVEALSELTSKRAANG